MPTVDFTLEDLKQVFDERLEQRLDERFAIEREHTRSMIQEGMNYLSAQFMSFIEDNFEPAMERIWQRFEQIDERFERIDQRFDRLEDRVDHLAGDVVELRVDMRRVKQSLQSQRAATS